MSVHDSTIFGPTVWTGILLLLGACSRPNPLYELDSESDTKGTEPTRGGEETATTTVPPDSGTASATATTEGTTNDGEGSSVDASDPDAPAPFIVAYPVPSLLGDFPPRIPGSGYDRALELCFAELLFAPPSGCDDSSEAAAFIASAELSLLDLPDLAPWLSELEIRAPDATTVIAGDYEQLVFGPLSITGDDARTLGLFPGGDGQYWTGSFEDGEIADHCDDWSSLDGPGAFGNMDSGTSPISAGWIEAGPGERNSPRHLLCLCWSP